MGKATVVSVFPFAVTETKPGMSQTYYNIPQAPEDGIAILQINDNFYCQPIPGTDPPQTSKITIDAASIAKSIVDDFCHHHLEADESVHPGMFAVHDHLTVDLVKEKYPKQIADAIANQNKWFERLIVKADDDWEQYRKQAVINHLQRYAARKFKLERPWISDISTVATKKCKFCQSDIPSATIKCPKCQEIVDPEAYNKLRGK